MVLDLWAVLLGGTLASRCTLQECWYKAVESRRYRRQRTAAAWALRSATMATPAGTGEGSSCARLADSEERRGSKSAPQSVGAANVSLLAAVADRCLQAEVRDSNGTLQDVIIEDFIAGASRFREANKVIGLAAVALGDFDKNLSMVSACVQKDPAGRRTLRGYLQAELDSGVHSPGTGSTCSLKDPSGACQLQWLLLGLELLLQFIKLVMEGDRDALTNAYAQTLRPYHNWLTSLSVEGSITLMGAPTREFIFGVQALCPGVKDRGRLAADISRDAERTATVMLPLVRHMMGMCRRAGLWECKAV